MVGGEKSTAYLGSHVKWSAQGCRMVEQLADSGNGAGMVPEGQQL